MGPLEYFIQRIIRTFALALTVLLYLVLYQAGSFSIPDTIFLSFSYVHVPCKLAKMDKIWDATYGSNRCRIFVRLWCNGGKTFFTSP